jgi:hypothetical protein
MRSDASDKTAKQNESDDHFRLADQPVVVGLRSGLLSFSIVYMEVKCEGQLESLEVLGDSSFRDSDSR